MANLSSDQISRFETQTDLDAVLALKDKEVHLIDTWLLSSASKKYQKVAMLVAHAIKKSDEQNILTNIPDIYFGFRVEALVKNHQLQGVGDLTNMRASEVCLAN